jgi:hypothetical protein
MVFLTTLKWGTTQLMTAACFTGKFPRLVFVHRYTPGENTLRLLGLVLDQVLTATISFYRGLNSAVVRNRLITSPRPSTP